MPMNAVLSDYNRVLTIRDVQRSHSGKYWCKVDRQLGQSTQRDLVIVVEGTFTCSAIHTPTPV